MEMNIRELEQQRAEIDQKIREYRIKEEKERIIQNEKEYVGKCYKLENENGYTDYYKCLSGLTNSSLYYHCMMFCLPVKSGFKHKLRLQRNDFDYEFNDNMLSFESVPIKNLKGLNACTEISVEEFESALKEYGRQLIEISRDDYTMGGKYYKEYK